MPQGTKQWHPFCDFRDHTCFQQWEKLEICKDYLSEKAQEGCKCLRKRRELPCRCLEILQGGEVNQNLRDAVALYMVEFHERKREDQYTTLIDWIKYSDATLSVLEDSLEEPTYGTNTKLFFLPFVNRQGGDKESMPIPTDLSQHKVCRSAIAVILDWGIGKWDSCRRFIRSNSSPSHGLKGKRPNNVKEFDAAFLKQDLHEYFTQMEDLAQPAATQFIRQEVGVGLRQSEEGIVDLPPSFTKRTMYYRYCLERGWTISKKPRTILEATKTEEFEGDYQEICSWYYFLTYWKTNFPKLRVINRSADVCSKCHVFRNRLRYVRYETSTEPGMLSSFTEDSIQAFYNSAAVDQTQQHQCVPAPPPPSAGGTKLFDSSSVVIARRDKRPPDLYSPLLLEEEEAAAENARILEEATLHVHQAADQRKLANEKIQQALHDGINNVPHERRTYSFVVDYCQNAGLPNLAATQPGDTYYMTPLTVPILGCVDCSVMGGFLDAYIYHEGVGAKGGDNVASIIMENLRKKGYLQEDSCGYELNVIMDNCQGQNKNNMVLRLALLLVESGYFSNVNFCFYVVGHTKNVADRWFNIMKKNYRNQNLFTMEQLATALRAHEHIDVTVIKKGEFKMFDKFLNIFYKKIKNGAVQPGHIFSVGSYKPTTMIIKQDRLGTGTVEVQDLAKRTPVAMNRWKELRELVLLETHPCTGIKDIKKIELYTKWRKLVFAEYRDIICPYPGDDVMLKYKDEQRRKARERAARNSGRRTTAAAAAAAKKRRNSRGN